METKIAAIAFGILAAALPGRAQSCYHGPQAGDVVRAILCDTTGITPGASGQNVTWTINATAVDTNPYYGYYVDPATTPFASTFPTATLAAHQSSKAGLVTYSYTRVTADSSISLGAASTALSLPYNDPLSTPLCQTYGDSTTDTYGDAYTTSTVAGASTVTHSRATVSNHYDGAGKLVLPWITFNNAIRTQSITRRFDSTWTVIANYQGPVTVVETNDTSYTWLDVSGDRNTSFSISYVHSHSATSAGPAVDVASKVVGYNEPVSGTTALVPGGKDGNRAAARLTMQDGRLRIRRAGKGPGSAVELFGLRGEKIPAP